MVTKDFNIKLQPMRASKNVLQRSTRVIKNLCKEYDIEFCDVKTYLKKDYADYNNTILAKAMASVSIKVTESNTHEISSKLSLLDNFYSFHNCKNFIINLNSLPAIYEFNNQGLEDVNFDACGDVLIDLEVKPGLYLPVALKVVKGNYQLTNSSGKHFTGYNVAALLIDQQSNEMQSLWNATFCPTLYPRILVATEENIQHCRNCDYGNIKPFTVIDNFIGQVGRCNYCLVGKNRHETCSVCGIMPQNKCIWKDNELYSISINADLAINLYAYICKMYEKRGTVTRKNSLLRKHYEQAKIHTPSYQEELDSDHIISLDMYAKQEYQKRKEWKGGHHNSPVEHDRKGHLRHYRDKDGNIIKTVQVRPSHVVGQNKNKVIYRVE